MTLRFALIGFACTLGAAAVYGCSSPHGGITPTGDLVWSASYGESYSNSVLSLSVDPGRNLIVSGTFGGTIDFGGGPIETTLSEGDGFLLKLDGNGKHLWSRALGDATRNVTAQVSAGPQGELYICQSENPVWLGPDAGPPPPSTSHFVKLDDRGNEIWKKPLQGETGSASCSLSNADPRGGVVMTGQVRGDFDLGDGPIHASVAGNWFVASYDAEGALRYKIVFAETIGPFGIGAAVGPNGDVAVTGGFPGTLKLGDDTLVSEGIDDVFVLSLDPDGKPRFARRFGTSGQDFAAGVAVGPDGAVVITAELSDGVDLGAGPLPGPPGPRETVAVFEPNGDLRFATDAYALLGGGNFVGAQFDVYGDVVLASMSSFITDPQLTILELDAAGVPLWQHTYGQHGEVDVPRLAVDGTGAVLIAAKQSGTIDLGTGVLTNDGTGENVLVAKLAP
jgi:hypothetical protein